MTAEAKRLRVNVDTVYKMRVFADSKKGYDAERLKELCRLCERYGRALGFSFVVKFLTIHNKAERARFQKKVIAKGMSLIQVKLALAVRYGRRKLHGQQGKRPKIDDLADLLGAIDAKCIWWRRLDEMLSRDSAGRVQHVGLSLQDIPATIRDCFKNAVTAIDLLEKAVKSYLDVSRDAPKIKKLAKLAVEWQRKSLRAAAAASR